MQQRIDAYFADKETQLVEAVSRLVRIDSTIGEAKPGKPFGEGPAAALEEIPDIQSQTFLCEGSYWVEGDEVICTGVHG